MDAFTADFKTAAYNHVRCLVGEVAQVADSRPSKSSDSDNNDGRGSPPPMKTKLDPRAASLKFLSGFNKPAQTVNELDKYLAASVDENVDVLQYWKASAAQFPGVAEVARKYISVPATSAASERQFSASGRLVSKLRSRLDTDRVDSLIFLYENM